MNKLKVSDKIPSKQIALASVKVSLYFKAFLRCFRRTYWFCYALYKDSATDKEKIQS